MSARWDGFGSQRSKSTGVLHLCEARAGGSTGKIHARLSPPAGLGWRIQAVNKICWYSGRTIKFDRNYCRGSNPRPRSMSCRRRRDRRRTRPPPMALAPLLWWVQHRGKATDAVPMANTKLGKTEGCGWPTASPPYLNTVVAFPVKAWVVAPLKK